MKLFKKSVALVLGGGGARGLSHIGVLKVLEREGIPIGMIVGTSIGAMVGGAYACGVSPDELERKVRDYINSPEFQASAIKAWSDMYGGEEERLIQRVQSFLKNQYYLIQMMFKPGILSVDTFRSMIDYFIPDKKIEDARIPFRAVATDLISGEIIVFSKGSIRQAVMASSAVPGAMEPIKEGGMLLSDGGVISQLPVRVARKEGADIVIAVALDRDLHADEEPKTVKDIYYRAWEIASDKLQKYELREADVIIRPYVKNLHWTGFSQAIDLINEGEKATQEMLDNIRSTRSRFKAWFGSLRALGFRKQDRQGNDI